MANVLFDIHQREGVVLAGKTDRVSAGAGSRSPPDPMHVIFRILRQIVIEHVTDTRDVQTSRCHVCRNEHAAGAFCESLQELLALFLGNIARQHAGGIALLLQGSAKPVAGHPHVRKHQYTFAFRLAH